MLLAMKLIWIVLDQVEPLMVNTVMIIMNAGQVEILLRVPNGSMLI